MRPCATALVLLAVLAAGCGGQPAVPPGTVARSFAGELTAIDHGLDGVARVLPAADPATRTYAAKLWSRAIRADVELRRRLAVDAPAGRELRTAARETRAAARELTDAADAGAVAPTEHLAASRAALDAAAAAFGH